MDEIEIQIYYPPEWEDEYKRNGAIAIWSQEFPEMFDGSCGTHKPPYARTGTLENFPNYALMYLLQKNHGVHSITYFRLGSKASKDGNRLQVIMRKWMGDAAFEKLRSAIQADPKLCDSRMSRTFSAGIPTQECGFSPKLRGKTACWRSNATGLRSAVTPFPESISACIAFAARNLAHNNEGAAYPLRVPVPRPSAMLF